MNVHEKIAREMWEERRGMTEELRKKIRKLPRSGSRPRKISPAEYKAIIEIFGDADENGRGWFSYEDRSVAFSPDKMWRF